MGLSDWTDLDLLARKIAESQDRLEGARATQNHGLIRLLEKEMAAAEILRDRMLSDIAAYGVVQSYTDYFSTPSRARSRCCLWCLSRTRNATSACSRMSISAVSVSSVD